MLGVFTLRLMIDINSSVDCIRIRFFGFNIISNNCSKCAKINNKASFSFYLWPTPDPGGQPDLGHDRLHGEAQQAGGERPQVGALLLRLPDS